jgi:quinol monooxygenase YgiN
VVRISLTLAGAHGRVSGIVPILRGVMADAQRERACLRCVLSSDLAHPDTLHYVEEWETERDLRTQLQGERFQRLFGLMEVSGQRPRVSVQIVSRSCGLEYLEDARREGRP